MLRKLLAAACFALLAPSPLYAAPANTITQQVGVCDPNYPTRCIAPDASGNMPVTGTFSASLGGFTPSAAGARGTPLSVTTSDSSGTLPTGVVVAVTNVGANPMFCNVNGIAATASDQMITASGGWFAFTIPNAITTLRCIATGGSTTANMVGGSGLPTGTGGGGGSGGAITAASSSYAAGAFSAGAGVDGWDLTQGAKADAACATDNGACSIAALVKRGNQNLTTLNTTAAGPIVAGTARIGYVTDDPCSGAATKVYTPISIATAASTVVSTGVAAKKKYICALMLYPAAADNVAIIQATTATACATAPVGLIGGATAATGIVATAQAGFVIGTGSNAVAATTVNQTDICLITSAAVQLSGVLVTVDQ